MNQNKRLIGLPSKSINNNKKKGNCQAKNVIPGFFLNK